MGIRSTTDYLAEQHLGVRKEAGERGEKGEGDLASSHSGSSQPGSDQVHTECLAFSSHSPPPPKQGCTSLPAPQSLVEPGKGTGDPH